MQLSPQLTEQLDKITGGNIYCAPMSEYTSFKIGGAADVLVQPSSSEQIQAIIRLCGECETPYTVIGNGSNLLVSDNGIRGVVIMIGGRFSDARITDNHNVGAVITAQSGALLGKVANLAAANGLSGLEFASGIPGTLGGALFMNAGAYGGEMKDVALWTEYMTPSGEICTVEGDAHSFRYRGSMFADGGHIILQSEMWLLRSDEQDIRARMSELNAKRREKQPLNMPSAGSTFKRPKDNFAGTLIEQCGLKGYSVGGAQVSEKHAGFIVNTGGASADDVMRLMEHVQNVVYTQQGVMLEPEVRMLGF